MNKFFKKLLITFASITLGYTTLILSYNLYSRSTYERARIAKKNETFIEQIRSNLDSKFLMAKNVVSYMKYNEYLLQYNEGEGIDHFIAFKLQSVFSRNQSSFSELGYLISVLKEDTDMVITPFGTRDLKSFLRENGINPEYAGFIEKSFDQNINLPMLEGNLKKKLDTSEIPFTGRSITITEKFHDGDNKMLFFLVFYEESLLPKNMLNSEDALIVYDDNKILFNNSQFDNRVVRNIVQNGRDLEGYNIYQTRSNSIPNGGYVYITPEGSSFNIVGKGFYRNLIIYFFLILFSLSISLYVTKSNYKPINNILDTLNWEGNDKDEFHFIQESAKRIQDANTELHKSIAQDKMPLLNKFLRDTLNGLLRNDEIEKDLKKYDLDIQSKNITVVAVQFNDDQLLTNFSNETLLNIRATITLIITEHLKQKYRFNMIEMDYHSAAAIIYDVEDKEIRQLFKSILSDISSNEELDITVSIGTTVNSFINIKRSYFAAVSELEKWDGLSKTLLPVQNSEDIQSTVNFFYPLDTERRIIKYISTGKDDSLSLVHSVIDRNKESLHLSSDEWKSFLLAIIRTIKRVLIQINKTEKMFIGETSIQDFVFAESRSLEEQNLLSLFRKILHSVQETSKGEQKTFADKLVKYVQENYPDPNLSLIDIAEFFNLSPAYISRIFKDFTGRNFKDLLSGERIDRSKEILTANPNIKVYKLGEEVGFNSTNTFLRTFKKYTGISPGKFAKSVLEG